MRERRRRMKGETDCDIRGNVIVWKNEETII